MVSDSQSCEPFFRILIVLSKAGNVITKMRNFELIESAELEYSNPTSDQGGLSRQKAWR